MNKKFNDDFLQPLKKRPGLISHATFKQNLKEQLMEEALHERKSRTVKNFIPSLLIIALFFTSIFILQSMVAHNTAAPQEKEELEKEINRTSSLPNENSETDFALNLTQLEEEIYNKFSRDLNIVHLKNVSPLTIAKLYVQANLDARYDVQYALYTDREDFMLWTKEEDENIPITDRGTAEQTQRLFKNIDTGTFVQTSDFEGYIEFHPYEDPEQAAGFKVIKNPDGIWQVSFMPIQ